MSKVALKDLAITILSITIVLFVASLFQGCAFQSALVDSENDRAGFVVTKPPMQISYRGDMTPEAQAFTLEVVKLMSVVPFKDYKFNENHNVRLNSIDAKSDDVTINLHESAANTASTEDTNSSY